MLWLTVESQALRDAAVNKMSKAELKHVDRKIYFNPDQPVDVRAQQSVLRGLRKTLVSWNFQKQPLWVDDVDMMTIHFNMNLVAKVGISDGKISMTYGSGWEKYFKDWGANLEEIIQKSNAMLERAGAASWEGKGKSKGKTAAY